MASRRTIPTAANFVERVEVLKGPSALLNGMPPAGAIGGSINLITKQAPDFPSRSSPRPISRSRSSEPRSISRGASASTRSSASGSTAAIATARRHYDNQTDEFGNAVLNMDYRGERVRVSADLGYQADNLSVPQRFRHHRRRKQHLCSAASASRIHLRHAVVVVLEAERQIRDGSRRGRYHRLHHGLWRVGMAP